MTMPKTPSAAAMTPERIRELLAASIDPQRILTREIDRIAFASDASFYRQIPQAVVQPCSEAEVATLFAFSRRHGIPLVFRAGGTSLSGQSITDGILVDLGRHMRALRIEDGGRAIRLQPGVIGQHANDALRLYQRKIGPDPASIHSCRVGGILSNNASGMCCGVVQNAYHTLRSLTFMLPSGTRLDTAAPDADQQMLALEPALHHSLLQLRAQILAQPALVERIRSKYRSKNTTGYSLNAFLDHDRAIDIFAHLLIGAEGTLAWIAEAVLETVPDKPVKYTGLLLFADLRAACAAIVPLREAGAAALELMDRAALRSVQDQPGVPSAICDLPPKSAALLVEFQYATEEEFAAEQAHVDVACHELPLLAPATLTRHPVTQAQFWKMRKGMFPSVGAVRARGTTVIIEDVAFPVEQLADAALDLRALLDQHGYREAILFGHAKDGNLHFVLTQGFQSRQETDRYRRFIDALVDLVVRRYQGALKAEHGTGRNMAPFVEAEWGPEALQIMQQLKQLADPDGLLNPGVILNPNPLAHLEHLKDFPIVEEEVDKCIECGYCEPSCPSRDFTLTPRQRIVVRREMARISSREPARRAALERDFPYMALDTCAVDGLCATDCPVKIDTGQLTRRLRASRHSALARWMAETAARNFSLAEAAVRSALRAGHLLERIVGQRSLQSLTQAISRVSQRLFQEPFWQWTPQMPPAAGPILGAGTTVGPATAGAGDALWYPSCIHRMMGPQPSSSLSADDAAGTSDSTAEPLHQVAMRLAARAGVRLQLPPSAAGTCCGVPFSSKGFTAAHRVALDHTVRQLHAWTRQGQIPVVVDNSPCTLGLQSARPHLSPETQPLWDQLRILDSIAFAQQFLLPRLKLQPVAATVALHPVCSVVKMQLTGPLTTIAESCADRVVTPEHSGCCAFAGDRGFLIPALTAAATAPMARQIASCQPQSCYSSSRTCEIAMTQATGRHYQSFLHLLDEASRP